jgi:hypothetical protein
MNWEFSVFFAEAIVLKLPTSNTSRDQIQTDWTMLQQIIRMEVLNSKSRSAPLQGTRHCGSDTYCVTVQPGIDQVFAVLVIVALDELYHDV